MRKLSDEEVAKEVEDFLTYPRMYDPVLPMKNIYDRENNWPRLGIVIGHTPTVWLMMLAELRTGPIKPQLEGRESVEFESVEDMVRAGWIGD